MTHLNSGIIIYIDVVWNHLVCWGEKNRNVYKQVYQFMKYWKFACLHYTVLITMLFFYFFKLQEPILNQIDTIIKQLTVLSLRILMFWDFAVLHCPLDFFSLIRINFTIFFFYINHWYWMAVVSCEAASERDLPASDEAMSDAELLSLQVGRKVSWKSKLLPTDSGSLMLTNNEYASKHFPLVRFVYGPLYWNQ